ncbi:hypothetical protein HCUR_01272 [Holospora curviuscula]|uniref:Transposase n=1 Tax=Holospora curviuscula TaxID=1082868 RepID=A0A2S5R7K9_9PROT|nr:hypothetical protein HCUR_01272 [Holospora curviuscula]
MRLQRIRDDQWEEIKERLSGKKGDSEPTGNDNQKFINAVMWIARKSAP